MAAASAATTAAVAAAASDPWASPAAAGRPTFCSAGCPAATRALGHTPPKLAQAQRVADIVPTVRMTALAAETSAFLAHPAIGCAVSLTQSAGDPGAAAVAGAAAQLHEEDHPAALNHANCLEHSMTDAATAHSLQSKYAKIAAFGNGLHPPHQSPSHCEP